VELLEEATEPLDATEELTVGVVDSREPLESFELLEKSGKKSQALRTNEAKRPMISLLRVFM